MLRHARLPIAALTAVLASLLAGCGSTHHRSPIPVKPGAVPAPGHQAPSCGPKAEAEIREGKGQLGNCSPTPGPVQVKPTASVGGQPIALAASHTVRLSGATGPDTSNNDPVYRWHPVRRHGHPFAFTKLNQGVRFVDRTAAAQVAGMRAAHVLAGGYDFSEVCRTNARSEANLFLARRAATRATGLPAVLDAEWPLSVPCSAAGARAWIQTWVNVVHAATHRRVIIYTGAWWWNPNVGCWWPKGVTSWISGYGVRFPPVPCGLHRVDLWQYTDHGFNGAIYSDMSVLRVPLSRLGNVTLSRAEKHALLNHLYRVRKGSWRQVATFHRLLEGHGCKTVHPTPRYGAHACPAWKRAGNASHAHLARLEAQIRHLHKQGVR